MADPLTTVTEEFAPAPTSYFDRGQAQTLISRYGNANREAASSKELADAVVQNQQLERSRAENQRAADKAARDTILASREDVEYEQRKEADESRSGFLKSFMEELDPKDPEYNTKLVGFMGELPSSIQKDPTFIDIVKVRSKQADEADEERRRLRELDIAQKNRVQLVDARAKYNPILANLTPEDLANIPKDEKGEPDMVLAMQKAMEKKYAREMEVDKAKVEARKEASIELKNIDKMDDAQKAVFKETKDIVITNREAFPSKVGMLQKKYGKNGTPASLAVVKTKPEYAQASEWDKNLFEKEVDAAMDKTLDEYVNPEGMEGISDSARERRKRVWDYANQNKGKAAAEPTTAPAAAPAPAAPTAAPAPAAPTAAPAAAPAPTAAPTAAPAAPTFRIVGDRIQVTHNGRVFYAPNTPENLKKIQGNN
jgi:hypothetical protein